MVSILKRYMMCVKTHPPVLHVKIIKYLVLIRLLSPLSKRSSALGLKTLPSESVAIRTWSFAMLGNRKPHPIRKVERKSDDG
jgi:hypothetical protein